MHILYFWLHPGSSLGKVSDPANLQTMSGCCLGECKFAQVQTTSREHQTNRLTAHQRWAHILPSSVRSVGAEHVNISSKGRWAGHTKLTPRNKCWTKCAAFLCSWNSWYNISGITRLCLDSLIHNLDCVGAPTGSWTPGVSREKNIKNLQNSPRQSPWVGKEALFCRTWLYPEPHWERFNVELCPVHLHAKLLSIYLIL